MLIPLCFEWDTHSTIRNIWMMIQIEIQIIDLLILTMLTHSIREITYLFVLVTRFDNSLSHSFSFSLFHIFKIFKERQNVIVYFLEEVCQHLRITYFQFILLDVHFINLSENNNIRIYILVTLDQWRQSFIVVVCDHLQLITITHFLLI